jgi:hypothetical protein
MRLILWFALCVSGCTSPAVRCDAHLVPINAPGAAAPNAVAPAEKHP